MPKIARPDHNATKHEGTANRPRTRIPSDHEIRAAVRRGRQLQARAIANLFASLGK